MQLVLSPAGGVMAPFERTPTQSGERLRGGLTGSLWGRADRIRRSPKSIGAPERGGSGRSSDDACGEQNLGRAKDPWGAWLRGYGENGPDMPKGQPESARLATRSEGDGKRYAARRLPDPAEAADDDTGRPTPTAGHATLEPYWGKPTVRNLRGGAGNGAMAARGGHSAERAEQQSGLATPERHRACALLDAGQQIRSNHPCPIDEEFSLMLSGMVKKPQGKPVIERKDMEVVSELRPPECEDPCH